MDRVYKTFRLAYETKYFIHKLVEYQDKQLPNNILENIENDILEKYPLDGFAFFFTVNATTGSIIELAVKEAEKLDLAEWNAIAAEVEKAKLNIKDFDEKFSTPKVLLSQRTIQKLEEYQFKLKQDNKRVPIMPYVIKLAVYNLYKKLILASS